MAKKLNKLLNYWFNPENYSIIKSINGIIDTVNELVDGGGGGGYTLPIATTETLGGVKVDGTTITANGDGVISAIGGGGGGSVETLNWTKVDTTVAIPALMDVVVNKLWQISSNDFGISGNHKGLMLESNYFEITSGELAPNNRLTLNAKLSNGISYDVGILTPTDNELLGASFNRLRLYVVKNPITGLFQMGFSATTETRSTHGNITSISDGEPTQLKQEILNPIVPLSLAADITEIGIAGMVKTETGAFATQGGVTFSLYVAD